MACASSLFRAQALGGALLEGRQASKEMRSVKTSGLTSVESNSPVEAGGISRATSAVSATIAVEPFHPGLERSCAEKDNEHFDGKTTWNR